ncbi:hypothetical protein Bca52824_041660 [Brassica carinata]|uniref:Uncharacterized protein n=1 Tax=Brassica carinata TaxID=52824 RepID=A0A8X7UZ08_BRACI|nr:hypothetical protein Bca52824_041660 [Brassica carinata]
MTRRNSSPVVTRGRLIESQGKGRLSGNGQQHNTDAPEPRRISNVSEVTSRRTLKTSSTVMDNNNNGLGRSLSKVHLIWPLSTCSNSAENGNEANEGRRLMGKLSDRDMYESSRYGVAAERRRQEHKLVA